MPKIPQGISSKKKEPTPLDYSFREPSKFLKSKNLSKDELFTRADLLETSFAKFLSEDYQLVPALYPGPFQKSVSVFEVESIYRDLEEALDRTENKGSVSFTEKKMLEPLLEVLADLEEDALLAKELGLTEPGEAYPDWIVPPMHLLIAFLNSKDNALKEGLFNFHTLMELSLDYFPTTFNFLMRSRLIAECSEPINKLMEFQPVQCEDRSALEEAKALIEQLEKTLIIDLSHNTVDSDANANFFKLLKLDKEKCRGRIALINSPAKRLSDFIGLRDLINYRSEDSASMYYKGRVRVLAIYALRLKTIFHLIESYKECLNEWLLKVDTEAQGLTYEGPIVSSIAFRNPFSNKTKAYVLRNTLSLIEEDLMRSAEDIGEYFVYGR